MFALRICLAFLLFALFSSNGFAQSEFRSNDIKDDRVAIGFCGFNIVLAVKDHKKAAGPCAGGWRCRNFTLSHKESKSNKAPKIAAVDLAWTGSKLAVLFEDQRTKIFDLTISGSPTSTVTHYVPDQVYRLTDEKGKTVWLSDSTHDTASGPGPFTRRGTLPPELEASFSHACQPEKLQAHLYQLEPEKSVSLYAPVFEFAPGETVFPTETNIWDQLKDSNLYGLRLQSTKEEKLQDELEEYLHRNKDESFKQKHAAVYYRLLRDFPGSWLFEYWTYYPFDVGHVQSHPHDTEHVFVEVDKIGGRIIGVLAAAHSNFTPNNLYSAIQADAEPVTLPIFVIVEKGKHALAPDINRDLKFTPGIDVNVFSETPQIWGIRDAIGQSDAHMRAYETSMTLNRNLHDAWAISDFGRYFDQGLFPGLQPMYRLIPLQGAKVIPYADPFSQSQAEYLISTHQDFQKPENIYKSWIFPYKALRVGMENITGAYESTFSVGYVSDVKSFPGLSKLIKAPLPGRIDLELMGSRGTDATSSTGQTYSYLGWKLLYGVQYERLTTNWFGYFASYHHRSDHFDVPLASDSLRITDVGQFGVFVQIPHKYFHNFILLAGPAFSYPGGSTVMCMRWGVNIWQSRGRTKFGNLPNR